ncbi:CoA transferase [Actinosynnema sp. NPDC020468]|uniref:CaiB/BaiF CoA transferase family protein n=1 Tax=Actinosynnema sp. NPDC020468 TaxID=3154488 RepID=UPI0033C5DE3D
MEESEFYRGARRDLTGPLDGVRVLDVTTVWSGPMATCVLADLGADVVRVELPGTTRALPGPCIPGTELSWMQQTVHRNKRSVALDLRTEADREVVRRLAREADVLVENFRPGTMAQWGLGYEDCAPANPGLVYVSVSGFGQFGGRGDLGGYDPVIQAACGFMALNGAADGPPVKAPTFLADDLAALHAVIGALAALRHRDHTGEGQHVDVAMSDAMLSATNGLLTLAATGVPVRRWGDETDPFVPANRYACADGAVYLVVSLDRHWRRLAEAFGAPELARASGWATNAERRVNRDAVNSAVAGWFRARTTADVLAVLAGAGLTGARVTGVDEVARDPHTWARGMLQSTRLADGTVAPLTGPAAKFSRTPTTIRAAAPPVGAHTAEVLAEVER